jgi:hypothetical protein
MQLSRIHGSNYPYKMNVPVYDAATLVDGEMVMRHGSWHSSETKYYITAYTGANTEAEDSIGVLQASAANVQQVANGLGENDQFYKIGTDDIPDAAISAGGNFLPCVTNPGARYYAFYDQTDAQSCDNAESAETAWVIGSLEDNIDGGWLFTTDQADSSATYVGLLRYLTASAAGTATVAAVTVDTDTDYCKVLPLGHRLCGLNAESTGLTTTAAASSAVFLEVVENYLTHSASASEEMRYWDHDNLADLKRLKVEGEVVQLRHCWRAVVA